MTDRVGSFIHAQACENGRVGKLSNALTLLDSDVKGIGLNKAAALVLALVDAVSGRTDACVFVWKYFSRIPL